MKIFDFHFEKIYDGKSIIVYLNNFKIMPAKSKKQQMAAGAALSAKEGKRSKKSLKGASKQMVESMSEDQLREMASTKRKGKPEKKK